MLTTRHARPRRITAQQFTLALASSDVVREIQAATNLVHRYEAYGLSRSSAGWIAEDHLRRALSQLQQLVDTYVAGARTWAGRAWRRRQMRDVLESMGEALWFTMRMQEPIELFWPPALFYRNVRPTVLDQAMLLLDEAELTAA
ncbi:hypothetical protein ACFYZ9_28320 [Streptomyces sp. NPDC001691]|uniref:hypothetical protein n=1 Tax=Streptomyces sp. NPDC001691 TaxID=3364600 RepID=UPI00367E52D4